MGVGFGDRLREERKRTGLNQADFAKAGGVHRNSQTEYETGKTPPNADYLCAIAQIGVDVGYLITGTRSASAISPDESELLVLAEQLTSDEKAVILTLLKSILLRGPPNIAKPA